MAVLGARDDRGGELPPLSEEARVMWEGARLQDARAALNRSSFVMLRALVRGAWCPVAVDRSKVHTVSLGIVKGCQLVPQASASEECRMLMQQPDSRQPTTVYLRIAVGHDAHSGYALFVDGVWCERSRETGSAGLWEGLEILPTRFSQASCFHLRSSQTGAPVCFDTALGAFVRRPPQNGEEAVVFCVEDFGLGAPAAAETSVECFVSPCSTPGGSGPPSPRESAMREPPRPLEVLDITTRDADTGESIEGNEIVRGSSRVQTVRFLAHEDLRDLTRVVRVRIGIFRTTTTVLLGSFDRSADVHDHVFPVESVPRMSPAISFTCEVEYKAANIAGVLFQETCSLKMV